MLAFGFILPFLPLYLREIGVTPDSAVVFWSGALLTSPGVSLAIFSPIWGALADRRGRKLMVLRSMLIRLGLASRSLMPLMVTLLLVQLSSAIVFPILPLFVERLLAPGHPVKLYAGLAFGATAVGL